MNGVARSAARRPGKTGRLAAVAFGALLVTACDSGTTTGTDEPGPVLDCSISRSEIFSGAAGKDAIPALTNPPTVGVEGPGIDYIQDEDRVVGIRVGDEALAVPIEILWWHEIVNLELGGEALAVTHCPLTGSSLVFDRGPLAGAAFGVSGLLYRNNLMMYDRTSGESLWPQMARQARCGPQDGTQLVMFPALEMTWGGWRTLFPETQVLTSGTGFGRNYDVYPYGDYAEIDNPETLFPMPRLDDRRPPKERVLGVPSGTGGVALPFGELAREGESAAIHLSGVVVFWDGARRAAMAYVPEVDGESLDFTSRRTTISDTQTGSTWSVDGRALTGPLAGRSLDPVPEAYVAFWFAWASFQPDTELWESS